MSSVIIRTARPSDIPLLLQMLRASAAEQGSPDAVVVTESDLLEDGFGPRPRFKCDVAEVGEEPAGIALYFFNYSTWVSRMGLYLEDIYVEPKFRRTGVAQELMRHLVTVARNEGCRRMQWLVYRQNQGAIRFYQSIGAQMHDDWVLMSLRRRTDGNLS